MNTSRISRKLKKYYLLDSDEFKSQIKKIGLKNHDVICDEFENSKARVMSVLLKIDDLKAGLDKAIYDLYDLSFDDIEIIEKTLDK